jgi:hypothetical protein
LLHQGYGVDVISAQMGEPIEKIAEALFRSSDFELIKRRGREVLGLLQENGWTIERVFQQFGHGLPGITFSNALGMTTVEGQLEKKESNKKGE